MSRNVLVTETRSVQWPAGGEDKARLQPTVAAVLDDGRPASQTKTDQLISGALKVLLITAILAEDWRRVQGWLGKLIGVDPPCGKGSPSREVCCPQCGVHFLANEGRRR